MKRVDFFVEIDKRGRPRWYTLMIRLRDLPKGKRERKKFFHLDPGTPIGRKRSSPKDLQRRSVRREL